MSTLLKHVFGYLIISAILFLAVCWVEHSEASETQYCLEQTSKRYDNASYYEIEISDKGYLTYAHFLNAGYNITFVSKCDNTGLKLVRVKGYYEN